MDFSVFLFVFSVPLSVEIGKPVKDPIYQAPLDSTEVLFLYVDSLI